MDRVTGGRPGLVRAQDTHGSDPPSTTAINQDTTRHAELAFSLALQPRPQTLKSIVRFGWANLHILRFHNT